MRKIITLSAMTAIALLVYPLSLASQNSFSLSLDANGAAGDQATTSVNISPDQVVSIQVFGSNVQNATAFGIRFEYDASQVTYQGFDPGVVLPGTPQILPQHGTNPTFVEIGLASFGGQATVNSGLVGTIRFRTTASFSGTAIRLVSGKLSRNRQFETVEPNVRVELQVGSVTLSSDFDGDGAVGISDFLLFVNHFGLSRGDAGYDAKYDLDSNDGIGISDFLIFVNDFGTGGPPSGGGGGGGGGSGGPDLIVESPSVSNDTVTPGQSFTLWAAVRNQGNGQSAATTLRYYRSTDATITINDTREGQDAVESLSASGNSFESISLQAPKTSGSYYYGACVESVRGESNTSNNCSSGVRVLVAGETFDQTVVQIKTLEANLEQNRTRVNQEISELQANHPLNAPKSQFETDAEYATRQSQLDSILAQSRQELVVRYRIVETQTQIAQLYRNTFPANDITATLGEYNPDEGYFPITFQVMVNGETESYNRTLPINRDDGRNLYDNWDKVVAKGYVVIGKAYRQSLVWIELEYTPIWPQGMWWSITEVYHDLSNNNQAVAFSADGKYILTGDDAGKATLWDVNSGESVWHTQVGSAISSVAFSQDGQYFAIGYHGQAGVWRTSNGTRIFTRNLGFNSYRYFASPVYAVAFSPDGQYLTTGDDDGDVTLWFTSDGERFRQRENPDEGSIQTIAYSSTGSYFATGSSGGKVAFWEASSVRKTQTIAHSNSIAAVSFTSDGNYLAVGEGQTITIYQVPTTITLERRATKIYTIAVSDVITDISYSPDGRFVSDGRKVYRVHLQRPDEK